MVSLEDELNGLLQTVQLLDAHQPLMSMFTISKLIFEGQDTKQEIEAYTDVLSWLQTDTKEIVLEKILDVVSREINDDNRICYANELFFIAAIITKHLGKEKQNDSITN